MLTYNIHVWHWLALIFFVIAALSTISGIAYDKARFVRGARDKITITNLILFSLTLIGSLLSFVGIVVDRIYLFALLLVVEIISVLSATCFNMYNCFKFERSEKSVMDLVFLSFAIIGITIAWISYIISDWFYDISEMLFVFAVVSMLSAIGFSAYKLIKGEKFTATI